MKIAQDAIEERDNLQLGAEPYKCDNAKLIKECNDLHLAFIQFKEQHEKSQKDLKRQINKLEEELEEAETEKQQLKKRIQGLEFDIVEQGNIITGIKEKKKVVTVAKSQASSRSQDKEFSKAMSVSDTKIKNLTKEIKDLKDSKLNLLDRLQFCENQINARDKEIERLTGLVQGGRPLKALNKDCCYKNVDNKCQALHEHIHKLKEENILLQNNLKDAVNKQHEAMRRALHLAERNKQLEKELKDIDQIALAVEAECNDVVKNKAETVSRLQDRVNESLIVIQNLERENSRLKQDKAELNSDLDSLRLEKNHLQRILEKEVDDKKTLTDKVNNFTIIEHDLNMEIDRLVRLSADQKRKNAELECLISSEKLKSYEFVPSAYKQTISETMEDRQSRHSGDIKSSSSRSPIKGRRSGTLVKPTSKITSRFSVTEPAKISSRASQTYQHKPSCRMSEDSNLQTNMKDISETHIQGDGTVQAPCGSQNCLRHMRELLDKEIDYRQAQATQLLETVRQEKDYYMKEYHKLMDEIKDRPSSGSRYADLMKQIKDLEILIKSLKDENKALHIERTSWRDSMMSTKSQTNDCQDLLNQQRIKRLEREIEILRGDLKILEEERDNCRKKYQDLLCRTDSEKERVKKAFQEMENHIKMLEDERRDLVIAQGTQRSSISQLEDNHKTLKEKLRASEDELRVTKANYNQLKNLHDQMERSVCELQNQLSRAESEAGSLKQQMKSTERMTNQSQNEVATLNSDISLLKKQLTKIDQEKDDLLNALDEKTEKNAALEEQLKSKNKSITSLEEEKKALSKKLSVYEEETIHKDVEVRSSRNELLALQSELDKERKIKEALTRENRRLQDDLTSVTVDCKDARNELEILHRQVEDLKRQLQIYVAEIKRTEDLISQKEVERNEILDQFKSLSEEATALETNNHTLENEATQNKVQLSVALDHASDLERRLEDKNSIIRSYEKQISELTTQLASYEMQCKQRDCEQKNLSEEAREMKDLCLKMDKEKDNLQREMLRRDDEILKIQRSLELLKNENRELQARLNRDRDNSDDLEKLLSEARQDIINQRLENQDLQNEISRLKADIVDLQVRLKSETSSSVGSPSDRGIIYKRLSSPESVPESTVSLKLKLGRADVTPTCCPLCGCTTVKNKQSRNVQSNSYSDKCSCDKNPERPDQRRKVKKSAKHMDKFTGTVENQLEDINERGDVSPVRSKLALKILKEHTPSKFTCDRGCIRDIIKNVESICSKSMVNVKDK
ncbi:centrosomal protein of 135 kDa isoform X3 [Aethina tumida]|nr:centrosomal protein of 135 kDa isoform X3 [Aethina tumida]